MRIWNGRTEFICLLAMLLLVAAVVADIVLSKFYLHGAYGDSAWFSVLAWHNHWYLRVPVPSGGTSTLFKYHVSWFFWLPSAISYIVPLDRITFFACFEGILYAILGLGFWLLLNELWPSQQPWAAFIKCAAAAAFALNGHSQSLLIEAHAEFAGPAFALIFFWALLARRNHPVALTAFILALSQREDMGFHIFGVLFLVLMTDVLRRVKSDQWRPVLVYAGAAFGYSLAALALQHLLFPGARLFSAIYAGPDNFGHVTGELLGGRLENLALRRYWIWGPGLIALLWALAARNPYVALGWLAFLPWLVLNLMAKAAIAGNFGLHYGYPFMIAGAWPLLAMCPRFTEFRRLPAASRTSALVWTLLLLAIQQPAQIYPEFRLKSQFVSFSASAPVSKPAYDEFERRLPQALKEMTGLRVDPGVFAIAPYALDSRLRIKWNQSGPGPEDRKVDAVIYFGNGVDRRSVRDLIAVNRLRRHYRLPETHIYLSTSHDLDNIPAFKDLFVPAHPPPLEVVIRP